MTTLIRKGHNVFDFYLVFQEIKFLIYQAISYFTAPIFFFNKLVEKTPLNGPYFGKVIFSGLIRLLPHSQNYSFFIAEYNSLIQTPLMIGPRSTYNAFPTAFFNYYIDGGLLAIILIAVISSIVIVWLLKRDSTYDILKTYIITILIFTAFKSSLDSPDTYIIIVLLGFIVYKEKEKI